MKKLLFTVVVLSACSYDTIENIEEVNIVLESERFSEEELIEEIKGYNFRFPHVVLAQAILESGDYTSSVFNSHNNLFGMKIAKQRTTCASKDVGDYAYYKNWRYSVVDRALYETTYWRKMKNEEDYINTVSSVYAEDVKYSLKLKNLIVKRELKAIFEEK